MDALNIRLAAASDAAALAAIYNHYIVGSTATFDVEPKTEDDRRAWIASRSDRCPVLVGELDGRVVAYASLSPWSPRAAWRDTAELGVYVADECRGQGVGPIMVEAAIATARDHGLHVLLAQVVGGNDASIRMLEECGFELVGTMREVGDKFSQRLDVVLLELVL